MANPRLSAKVPLSTVIGVSVGIRYVLSGIAAADVDLRFVIRAHVATRRGSRATGRSLSARLVSANLALSKACNCRGAREGSRAVPRAFIYPCAGIGLSQYEILPAYTAL